MGVIPMKEDVGQEIYTRDHGIVKVDKNSWQDGRFHVVLCPNGAYQHINGLPIKDESEIHEAFGCDKEGNCPNEDAKQKCLNWFRNRHDQLENPVRPIAFHSDGYPVFLANGSVPDFDDLYAFFKPGPILTAAIVALQQYNERKGTGQAPKELRKPVEDLNTAPWPGKQEQPQAFPAQEPGQGGENRAPVEAAPVPSPSEKARIDTLKAKERMAKARAARKPKSVAQPAPQG